MKKITHLLFIILLLAGCSSAKTEADYPLSPEDKRRARYGKLSGDEGLIVFGKNKDKGDAGSTGIGINSYLWRASLDTLSFMPFKSADPFGGVILTDWYEDAESKGERYKVDVLILDRRLQSNAVKVKVFRQEMDNKGTWRDAAVDDKVAVQLENKILTRARELRVEREKNG